MGKGIEMVGKRFGRLVVLGKAGKDNYRHTLWKCVCDCGNIKIILGYSLISGETKSCGCLSTESIIERSTKHGLSKTAEYCTWYDMIDRCNNPNHKSYENYGGRGITVCDRWLKVENFFEDMEDRPHGLTIERKNNDLGYFKENCKWATRTEQVRNRRISKRNTTGVNGVSWHKRYQRYIVKIGLNYKTIHIGSYATLKEAKTARKKAEQKYWGQQNEDTQ